MIIFQDNLQKAKDAESALEEIQSERFYNTLKSYYSYREMMTLDFLMNGSR